MIRTPTRQLTAYMICSDLILVLGALPFEAYALRVAATTPNATALIATLLGVNIILLGIALFGAVSSLVLVARAVRQGYVWIRHFMR